MKSCFISGGEVLEVVEVGVFWSGFYGARGFCEHFGDAVFAIGDEVFDEVGFGEVFPVAFGHFGLHGLHFEAGGVEDAAVVGAPCGFEGVGLIDGVVGDAGGEDEGLGVPVGAAFGGEDGPVHVGEAFAEEGGGGFDDVVVGLEPCGVTFAACFWMGIDELEADEGVHFVDFAADGFFHVPGGGDVWVAGDGYEVAFAAVGDAPEDLIEEGPAGGVAVAGDACGEVEEGGGDFGDGVGCGVFSNIDGVEEAAGFPEDFVWRDAAG